MCKTVKRRTRESQNVEDVGCLRLVSAQRTREEWTAHLKNMRQHCNWQKTFKIISFKTDQHTVYVKWKQVS